jgi:hypothetical protein
MTNREIEHALKEIIKASGAEIGDLHRLFSKVLVDHEKEEGWDAPNRNSSWTDEQLRVILSDVPTQDNCVKHAKAFGRGYGSIEQIYRWAATDQKTIKKMGRDTDAFIVQVKRIAKELGWRV